jgi:hypothetical protein
MDPFFVHWYQKRKSRLIASAEHQDSFPTHLDT